MQDLSTVVTDGLKARRKMLVIIQGNQTDIRQKLRPEHSCSW